MGSDKKRKRTSTREKTEELPAGGAKKRKRPNPDPPAANTNTRRRPNGKNKRWRDKPKYVYGNYPTYYHRRHSDKNAVSEPDPRLALLKPKYIRGKRILDLGCNTGLVTQELMESYRAHSATGVDIDRTLIDQAKARTPKEHKKKLRFLCANILETTREGTLSKPFDVVLLLSTSKWVHLNFGDEGALNLFRKLNELLAPGGLLVFEPQPWPSYKKAKILHERLTRHYRTLHIKPDNFLSILKARFGFKLKKNLAHRDKMKVRSGKNVGFKRPLYLLKKLHAVPEELDLKEVISTFGGPSLDERESDKPPNPEALKKSLEIQAQMRAAALKEEAESSEEEEETKNGDESSSSSSSSDGDW